MKRLVSILLVIMLFAVSLPSFAGSGDIVTPKIDIIKNEVTNNQTTFAIEWSLTDVKAGQEFTITFPFSVVLPETEGVNVIKSGNDYTFVFEKDFTSVIGELGGTKTFFKDDTIQSLKINGEATEVYPEVPNYQEPEDGEHNTDGRDELHKTGYIDGDEIQWIVTIGADGETDFSNLSVTDEIGDGHELITDTVQFTHYYINDQPTGYAVSDVIEDIDITKEAINFKIKDWYPSTYLHITYRTKVTDFDQTTFTNQLIVEGKQKLSEKVVVDSWGNIDTEEPEDNDDKPTTPPEELPQVGEFFLKPEYLIALIFAIAGFVLRKKGQ